MITSSPGRIPLPLIDGTPPPPGTGADAGPPGGLNPFGTQAKVVFAHFDRLAELRQTGDTFPILIEVNLTNYCNESCRWCISAYSHLGNPGMTPDEKRVRQVRLEESPAIAGRPDRRRGLDVGVLGSFLGQARGKGLRSVTWSGGGEPTTHPRFPDAVRAAAGHGLEQGLMTNGFFPRDYVPVIGQNLRWVRVSLDTIDRDRYRDQKAVDAFPRVVENIRALLRHPVQVGVNMNLAGWNVDELLPMARWCRDEGVSYFQVRPVLGLPFEMVRTAAYRTQPRLDWAVLRPELEEAERLGTGTFRVAVSWDKFADVNDPSGTFGRTYTKCLYHYLCCVLNADGDLCVCMYHLGDRAFSFGNVYEQPLDEIWAGPKRREVVEMCASSLDLSSCQVCCKGHEINKLMHQFDDPGVDVNFF
jgi:MoaA/NifB/PqqE/SkfB family radical SAM enzyme